MQPRILLLVLEIGGQSVGRKVQPDVRQATDCPLRWTMQAGPLPADRYEQPLRSYRQTPPAQATLLCYFNKLLFKTWAQASILIPKHVDK